MKKVLDVVESWRARIEDHPLHRWLVDEEDGIAPENKLWFSLYFANFIMYFRELNLYHVGYPESAGRDPRRRALTGHAMEDMTHSRLFMHDFKVLGWDKLLNWRPSEVFHWLFSSTVNEQLRRRTVTIAKLYIEAQDPAVRYAVIEAIEACGNALFRHTTKVAERYRARTGRDLIYWGQFHLARESGHAVENDEETLFSSLVLTPEQREEAIRRAVRAFELIDEQNSHMLELAKETIAQGGFAHRREAPALIEVLADPPDHEPRPFLPEAPEPYDFHFWPLDPHPSQAPLVETLRRCTRALIDPEMLTFFTTDSDEEALARMRLTLLFFATDCVGTPTFYRYMVPCPSEARPEARAINRMARRFGARSDMLYVDWRSLGLDDKLSWPVSRTLEFIYLDAATESHRDLRAAITHHIDVTLDPLQRYWALVALKMMTGVYSEPCAALARRVERRYNLSLPYLALRKKPRRELESDPEADAVRFETLPLAGLAVEQAIAAIERIGKAAKSRNDKMLESVRRRDYPEVA